MTFLSEAIQRLEASSGAADSEEPSVKMSGQQRRELAYAYLHLAREQWQEEREVVAMTNAEKAIEIWQRQVDAQPRDRVGRRRLALSLIVRGDFEAAQDQHASAQALYRRAESLAEALTSEAGDRGLRGARILAQLRLGKIEGSSEVAKNLQAAGFCDVYVDLCHP